MLTIIESGNHVPGAIRLTIKWVMPPLRDRDVALPVDRRPVNKPRHHRITAQLLATLDVNRPGAGFEVVNPPAIPSSTPCQPINRAGNPCRRIKRLLPSIRFLP